MDCTKRTTGRLICAVAAGVIAIAPMAQARHHKQSTTDTSAATTSTDTTTSSTTTTATTAGTGTTGSGMDTSMAMSSTPQQVTGTVQRYYVDRNGYVSAMDVQTANGTDMVRFAPGMGQRIFSTYPVGGQASVWVMGSSYGMGMTRWDVVGMGNTMPTAMMTPYMTSDLELLQSEPYISTGAKLVTMSGMLKRFITGSNGEVLGIVLSHPHMSSMMNRHIKDAKMNTPAPSGSMSAGMMAGDMGMMGGDLLVRVPREERQVDPGAAGTARRAGLFKGADVEVTGYPEAASYGVMSIYPERIAATAIVVNGRAVGAVGFPRMMRGSHDTLIGFDLGGTSKSGKGKGMMSSTPEEMSAMRSGYMTYDPSMSSGSGMMGTDSGSTSGGSVSGTGPATTPTQ